MGWARCSLSDQYSRLSRLDALVEEDPRVDAARVAGLEAGLEAEEAPDTGIVGLLCLLELRRLLITQPLKSKKKKKPKA